MPAERRSLWTTSLSFFRRVRDDWTTSSPCTWPVPGWTFRRRADREQADQWAGRRSASSRPPVRCGKSRREPGDWRPAGCRSTHFPSQSVVLRSIYIQGGPKKQAPTEYNKQIALETDNEARLWSQISRAVGDYFKSILNIVICDVIRYCASSCDNGRLSDKWYNFNPKPEKDKEWDQRNFLHKIPSKGISRIGFNGLLRKTDARRALWRQLHFITYCSVEDQAHWVTSQITSCIEYLIPTETVIHYINLMKRNQMSLVDTHTQFISIWQP